jgi:hypothetical protein
LNNREFIRVKQSGASRKKKRKYTKYVGLGPRRRKFVVHEANLRNLLHALIERVFFVKDKATNQLIPPPRPVSGKFTVLQASANAITSAVMLHRVERMSLDDFVDSCPQHKKKLYKNAMQEYHKKGYSRLYSAIKVFTKFEKIDATEKDPVPRVISPRSPIFNLLLGTFLRPIEKRIYAALDDACGGPTVMKNYNATETATCIVDAFQEIKNISGKICVLSLDAARFDQHVSVDALKFEHSLYKSIYGESADLPLLVELLSRQLITEGSCYIGNDDGHDYKVTYSHKGGRCSGDMNTSLGNVILMVLMTKHVFGKYFKEFRIINNGDDCLVMLPYTYEEVMAMGNFKADYLEFGFNVKEEAVAAVLVEQIEFCQSHPVNINGTWTMVRNLSALDKDMLVLQPHEKVASCISETGLMGRICSKGVPLFQEFYARFPKSEKRMGRDSLCQEGWLHRMGKGMEEGYSEPSDETRLSFYLAFGVCPQTQLSFEDRFRSVEYLPRMEPTGYYDDDGVMMEWGF